MIARVSAEVVAPFADRPFDGLFTITTELGPMASPAFETGRQTEAEVLLARLIEKAIRRSAAIDTESLCVVAGQRVWHVRADVHFLNHDGGLVDAACVAVVAALHHFRRPDVSVAGERVTIHTLAERVPVPLSILQVGGCPGGIAKLPCNGGLNSINGNGNTERSYVIVAIDGKFYGLIGTSVSSPELAGATALLIEQYGRMGNLNHYIYNASTPL